MKLHGDQMGVRKGYKVTLSLLLLVSVPTILFGQMSADINVKGLYIGMAKSEVLKKFPTWKGFTVGGVSGTYGADSVGTGYRNAKLDHFYFVFSSKSFDKVLTAVKEKYPDLSCASSEVINGLGARFEQIDCVKSDSKSYLSLTRYVNSIDHSMVSLESMEDLKEGTKKMEKNARDF